MERIEEFKQDGKNFVYIDFSGLKTDVEFREQIELIKKTVSKYPEQSVYTITNLSDIRFDPTIKDAVLDYLRHNKPYIKYAVIFGMDGIKKMMIDSMLKLSGRNNISCAFTKEKAIELALRQG